MRLLYIGTFMFAEIEGRNYGLPANAGPFFAKYLDVFDEVRVIGDPLKSFLDLSVLVPIEDERISIRILPANTKPKDFRNDSVVRKALKDEIRQADAILVKPSTRKGMMAEKIAKELGKPFMVELTGDIHNALRQQGSLVRKLYASILYQQIKHNMKDCQYGLYVSRDYLQSKYPVNGLMCGCADVILEPSSSDVLAQRLEMIESIHEREKVEIALIGFYQGLMKGVDTAIRALSLLPNNFHLNVLGNGTQENRDKWIRYGEERGVFNRIHFPAPLPSSHAVLQWLDTQDFFVLPTLSEGFGRCVAEAMSRGCVCFCTDICTMPELLPKECLFPKKDDVSLAGMIKGAYDNPSKMKKLATINFEHAKDYDFELLRERRNAFLQKFKAYCEQMNKN